MMGDSDDDFDSWRSRDKYPKEREISPMEQRNDKRSFNNYQSPSKTNEPPFKRSRREDDFGSANYRRYQDDNINKAIPNKTFDDTLSYPTQPPMLQFKSFLQQQDDDIEVEEAMKKYNEYKLSFTKKQLKAFFDTHHAQEWFKEKYSPLFIDKKKEYITMNITKRKEIFRYLESKKWLENIKLHYDESEEIIRLMDAVVILLEGGEEYDLKILDSRRYRSESPNQPSDISDNKETNENNDKIDSSTENDVVKKEDKSQEIEETNGDVEKVVEEKKEEIREPRALHKTYSIFLRNLHPNVLRSEIEALVKPYDGFLRLALQDPTPDRKFFRRGWVTYNSTVNIKEICWNLNNVRLHDCDIGAIVNRELTQRVRPIPVLSNHKPVMKQDVKIAAKLVAKFDKRHALWQTETEASKNPLGSENPLLNNITEYLVDEGGYEEEALLGGNLNTNLELTSSGDPTNIKIETDDALALVLDKLILYLRFVHSFDYYSTTEYQIEDEMPHRCGIFHVRGNNNTPDKPISQKEVEEYIKNIESKAEVILSTVDFLTIEEAKKLGYKETDEAIEAFIQENTQKLAEDKFLCPLSGKKFKGPEFVRKHILNKHMDKLEEGKIRAQYFNNYLLDNKRPQLPEHPSTKGGVRAIGDNREEGQTDIRPDNRGRNFDMRGGMGGGGMRNDDRRNNYRNDRGSPGYRNNFDGGRGGMRKNMRGGGRYRNGGGGSYYSRKMMNYNDLDAPVDD